MPPKLSRDEYRRAKELEDLRRAGVAPAAVDPDSGRALNPHLPAYLVEKPFYASVDGHADPGLAHQYRKHFGEAAPPPVPISAPRRGRRKAAARRFRKGACENCGAMTHKRRDCVERPRRRPAKYSGRDLRGDDEAAPEPASRSYAAKRDRYAAYDPATHRRVVEKFERAEAARRLAKEAEIDAAARTKTAARDSDEEDSDDSDGGGVRGVEGSIHQRNDDTRTSVRNLRLREDRAKYLLNLDPNSAHYAPGSRSMRENPLPHLDPEKVPFAGDNFVRGTGQESDVKAMEAFVWEANRRGNQDVNIVANPSAAERMHTQFKAAKKQHADDKRRAVLDKYGGAEHLDAPPAELRMAQTEAYTEYAADGTVVAGHEAAVPSTKYAEDVHEQNHTSVWGSFFRDGRWGYACCRQCVRNAYCTGGAAERAAAEVRADMAERLAGRAAAQAAPAPGDKRGAGALAGVVVVEDGKQKRRRPNTDGGDGKPRSLDDAILEAERRRRQGLGPAAAAAAAAAGDTSEANLEAYQRERQHADDPLAAIRGDRLL